MIVIIDHPGNDHQADGGGGGDGVDGEVVWRNCRLAASASKDRRVGELRWFGLPTGSLQPTLKLNPSAEDS